MGIYKALHAHEQALPLTSLRLQPCGSAVLAASLLARPATAGPLTFELPRQPVFDEEHLFCQHRSRDAALRRSQERAPRLRELVRERTIVPEAVALKVR